ncbi:MAG: DUF6249 domain-containing protein [Tunicatimonas sp.]
MEDIIVPIGVVGIVFFGVVSIIKTITDYQLRRKLIQLGHVDQQAVDLLQKSTNDQATSLKWGLIILFGGIGLIIISVTGIEQRQSALPFGVLAVCLSLGFLLYHFLRRNKDQMRATPPKTIERTYPEATIAAD